MITIVDKTQVVKKSIRTNDVPRNTVFRGTIITSSGTRATGLWLHLGDYENGGPFTVGLTPRGGTDRWSDVRHYISTCSEVLDYEPVDITITIEGLAK